MKGQVFGIFPTPVLKFKMDREFTKQEIDFVYDQQDKVPQPPYFINLGNIATTSKRILERPEMASLKKIVEDCLNQWCINIYAPRNPESFKLKITQSWLNYTKPGEHHDRHYHPNSIVSGAIYIDTNPVQDQIIFNSGKMYDYYIPWVALNQFNSMESTISLDKKDIVLFPSNLNHSVPENTGTTTRVSLAFNSFFQGTLGVSSDVPNYIQFNSVE